MHARDPRCAQHVVAAMRAAVEPFLNDIDERLPPFFKPIAKLLNVMLNPDVLALLIFVLQSSAARSRDEGYRRTASASLSMRYGLNGSASDVSSPRKSNANKAQARRRPRQPDLPRTPWRTSTTRHRLSPFSPRTSS